MNVVACVCGLCLAMSGVGFAQEPLTDTSIDELSVGRIGDVLIVGMIQNQPGNYDISANALVKLKQDGVSDYVLSAMVAKTADTAVANSPLEDLDVGVYFKRNGQWTRVTSEHVNWKEGGVLKSAFTDHIIKHDGNGHIEGAGSATNIGALDFLIKTPEGVDATDFQLVSLHEHRNSREFRRETGGVFHASGGPTRDEIYFGQTKIANHVYKITLPQLGAGEYAFLAPGNTGSSASGTIGKAYSFHLGEAEGGWQP